VLRLATLLWRLRRATRMETGLLDIQAEHIRDFRAVDQTDPDPGKIVYPIFEQSAALDVDQDPEAGEVSISMHGTPTSGARA
jgi:hypothetical protein